jgi:hypothetical protein
VEVRFGLMHSYHIVAELRQIHGAQARVDVPRIILI